jgi:acyl-CoA thioesterase-1
MMKSISLIQSSSTTLMRLILLYGGLISLLLSATLATAADAPSHKILILGDSLSAAYGIRRQDGWTYLLQTALADRAIIINASVSGETTAGGVQRLPRLIKEHQPNIVVIELGGNDGLRGYPTSGIRKNLQTLISTSMDADAKVLLIGMQIPPNYGKRYTDAFAQNYVQLADKYTLALVPFLLESVAGRPALMQSDGIHPTAEAQALILQNVLPTLRALLD